MKELKPRTEGLERGIPKTESPKSRRVSQRKELAVVTLGMVASITGVDGLLAASPPLGLASEGAPATRNVVALLVVLAGGPAPRQAWTVAALSVCVLDIACLARSRVFSTYPRS